MGKDWSIDFDAKLHDKFGGDVVRLEPYVNKSTTIKFRHKCGNDYYAVPRGVLKSKVGSCTKCRKRNTGCRKKKSNDDFKREVKALVGDEYSFLDPYTRAHDKIRCRHNKCDNVWLVKPNAFLNGTRCPNIDCIPKKPYKNRAQIEREIRNKTNDEYRMAEPYRGDGEKILFIHRYCGNKWRIKPNDILNGHGCPKCTMTQQWSTQRLACYITGITHGEYELLSEYSSMSEPVRIKHNKCGSIYSTRPASFKEGHRCYNCAMKQVGELRRISSYEFYERVYKLLGSDYEISEFSTRNEKVLVKHKRCGNLWKTAAKNILSGSGCPFCKSSRGERVINLWLKSHNIQTEYQKKFVDCKDQRSLPFDFYLPDYNLVIEYDGRQHFQGYDYFGGEEAYKIRHKHDLIKNKYCEDNNINLLRIPYTVTGEDIGKVIQNKLDELTQLDKVA